MLEKLSPHLSRKDWLRLLLATVVRRVEERSGKIISENQPSREIATRHQSFTAATRSEVQHWNEALRATTIATFIEIELAEAIDAWSLSLPDFWSIIDEEIGPQDSYKAEDIIEAMRKHFKFPKLFAAED